MLHIGLEEATYLKVMTALVMGQPITKEVAVSNVTCKRDDISEILF